MDSNDSYENVRQKWSKEVKHHCPDAPILLVGTKIDLRGANNSNSDKKMLTSVHGHALAKEVGAVKYVECSAATQDNLCNVFEEAVRLVLYPNKGKSSKNKKKGGNCKVM